MKTKPTLASKPAARRVAAQRIDAVHQFDMSAIAAAAAGASVADYTQIPVLPPSGAMGRDGRGPFTYDINVVRANVAANGADVPVFLDHQTGKALGWLDRGRGKRAWAAALAALIAAMAPVDPAEPLPDPASSA